MIIRPNHRTSGIALIVVMLVIFVLSVMVAGLAFSVKVETRLARNVESEGELLWLGRSGVELACWYLAEKNRDPSQARFDGLGQRWAGGPTGTNEPLTGLSLEHSELGRGSIEVSITDLERRFNINVAPREVLQRALEQLGYATLDSALVIDSIEDWRDANDIAQLNGAEADLYLSLPHPYVPKNGPIDDLAEILLVQGVSTEMFWGAGRSNRLSRGLQWGATSRSLQAPVLGSVGLVDLFNTVGGVRVNLNTASREVLQLVPGMDANLADRVVQERAGLDRVDGTEDDTPYETVGEVTNVGGMPPQFVPLLIRICSVMSETFEVRVRARVDSYQRTYVAILKRPPSASPNVAIQTINAYWE